jgi:chromate transporter
MDERLDYDGFRADTVRRGGQQHPLALRSLGAPAAAETRVDTRSTPTEREAFWFWLKLGMISFGGPAGQIAIMHAELVEKRRWISERRYLHALNFCMALPGPEAQQLASYVGYSMHGVRGALTAGGLFVLPSFVLLCVMSAVYVEFGDVAAVEGVVRGLGAAVIALVAAAVIRIGRRVVHTAAAVILAVIAFGLLVAGLPFPLIVALAALAGYGAARLSPALLGRQESHGDDVERERPGEARLRRRFLKTLLIWLVPVALLLLAGGLVAELAGFFTLAALITFGGAYAVLPFVADAAVNRFEWLTADDMVAGLALGESTPGPLIMVNTFVGFLAGYNIAGGLAWGLLGATIATACTFAPSFVFIITGAPLIDRIRTTGAFASSLNGITIAVVGVIAALAVFVAEHAAFDDGDPDWLVIALALASFVAAVRFKVGVVTVVATCAAIGLAVSAF